MDSALFPLWLALGITALATAAWWAARRANTERTVAVLVLGDFGRSPRMQNHAVCLADAGAPVVVFARHETLPHARVRGHERIALVDLPSFDPPRWVPAILALPLKAAALAVALAAKLMCGRRYGVLLLQNPPAVPTLAVAHAACALRGARLVIDWHNFAYTILRCSLRDRGVRGARAAALTATAEAYERVLGRGAAGNFCVSRAMAEELRDGWGVSATVLPDRPAQQFMPLDVDGVHRAMLQLQEGIVRAAHPPLPADLCQPAGAAAGAGASRTLCTVAFKGGAVTLREDRPAILVTSTSWTPDEDFRLLLRAVAAADARLAAGKRVLLLITGKGPLRAEFEARLRALPLARVHVAPLWVAAELYPALLACADLGICMHASSSAVDLPMKVVDLYGAGVPVCALRYGCIGELVTDRERGRLFSTAEDLAELVVSLLDGFPTRTPELDHMREHVLRWRVEGWDEAWTRLARPVLMGAKGGA